MFSYRLVAPLCLVIFCGFLGGCDASTLEVDHHRLPNLYGADDRHDWYKIEDVLGEERGPLFSALAADSTAVVLRRSRLNLTNPSEVLLCAPTSDYPSGWEESCLLRTLGYSVYNSGDYGNGRVPLCPDVPYQYQPKVGRCSATLIAPRLALTSGHCFDEDDDVETSAISFGWRYDTASMSPGRLMRRSVNIRPEEADAYRHDVGTWLELPAPGLNRLTRRDVYHVMRAAVRLQRSERMRPSGGTTNSVVHDYAIVELDRPVSQPLRPAPIEYRRDPVTAGSALVGLSYGKGMPLKADTGAAVVDHWYCTPDFNPGLFCNTHDGFSGGSGGGIFAADGRLLGAHRGSETDFGFSSAEGCYAIREVAEPVPERNWPGNAYHVGWAVEHFCRTGFDGSGATSELCGDPAYFEFSDTACDGEVLPAHSGQVCCERACSADSECDVPGYGGVCTDTGVCRRSAICFGGEEWLRDACGRPIERIEGSSANCQSLGDSCSQPELIEVENQRLYANLSENLDWHLSSCGGYGPDRVWSFTLDSPYRVRASLSGTEAGGRWILGLSAGDCAQTSELQCSIESGDERAELDDTLPAGTYFLTLDTDPASDPAAHPWLLGAPSVSLEFERLTPPSPPDAGPPDASIPDANPPLLDASSEDGSMMPPGSSDDGGCSCELSRRDAGSKAWVGWLVFLGAVLGTRRRRATHASTT